MSEDRITIELNPRERRLYDRLRSRLSATVRVEAPVPPTGGDADERFPHVYGPIEVGAVTDVVDFPCGPDGRFALPARLRSAGP